jgi:hypothetical protein
MIAAGGRMIRRPAAGAASRHTRTRTAGRAANVLRRLATAPVHAHAGRMIAPIGMQIGRLSAPARVGVGQLSLPARRILRPGVAA